MSPSADDDDRLPIRDEPTAREARFLLRGLRQLAMDPHAEVPADFHATVMAKARALPLPRQRLRERLRERLTVWAPVCAVALLLSLGVQVWQGIRALSPHPAGGRNVPLQPLENRQTAGRLPIYQFQVQLQQTAALGALAAARPVPPVPRAMVGFTSHAARTTFVRIGILYAQTLAVLQSGAVEAAGQRLGALVQAVASVQAPPVVPHYLREMQALLQRQAPVSPTVAHVVALFEPLYASVYAPDATAAPWVLFRAGAWLENLALAVAVGDHAAVRQAQQVVQSLQDALRSLHVPTAVLNDLDQLHVLMASQPMTVQDLRAVQALADTITQQLSN